MLSDMSRPDLPNSEVFLDFPLVKDQPLIRAKILHWFPVQEDSAVGKLEDIAVLELLSETPLPAGLQPAPVVVGEEREGLAAESKVRMCGFPAGVDDGTYANGILQGRTAKGWVEIHHQGKELVEGGFSGTAVWAVTENAVCGMTVSVLNRRNAVVAYMIPANVLITAFPEMEKLSRPANPYRGLEAFREKDANLYFGREQTITRVQQVIADQPFAAVIGASGSGKSSVVFAGLVPVLRQSGDWLIAHCRPKNQPLYELAACLIPLLYDDPLMRSEITEVLDKKFSTGSITLTSIIRQICEKHEAQYFLLIIDQFEELFTLNADKELIRQYIDLLLECLHTKQFTVLCTMRADFFAAAVSNPALAQALDSYAPIILPQLDEQGLREAVEQPASSLGVRFADGLVDLIIRDVGQEPGSLPLLEFCLTQLWERQEFREINHDAYKAIGGVQQALANHADAVYGEFAEKEREQLRHIFLKLVRPGQGTEDTRQVASVGQIAEEYRGLITRLADKRLLVTGRDEERGEETVEVVHEALIRRWQTLRQWVDEEREFLVWQEKLQVLLGQWEESGKDEGALLRGVPLDEALRWRETHTVHLTDGEREFTEVSEQFREKVKKAKEKQRRRNITSLVIGLAIAVLLSLFSVVQWRNAEQERQHAVEQKGIAEVKTAEAEQQTLEANYNLAKAFEEMALAALRKAQEDHYNESYQQSVLFTSTALNQNIKPDKFALKPESIGALFESPVFNAALSELWVAENHENAVVFFSPDGQPIIASYDNNNTVRLWNVAIEKEVAIFRGDEEAFIDIIFSPDRKPIVSTFDRNRLQLWNLVSGKKLAVFKGFDGHKGFDDPKEFGGFMVTRRTFSPDGKIFAASLWKESGNMGLPHNPFQIWDVASGRELVIFKGHEGFITSLSFSSDGKKILSGSMDGTAKLWDVASGKELITFREHESGILDTTFSPDGKTIASASGGLIRWVTGRHNRDYTIRLWETDSGKELTVFKGHEGRIDDITFSPDGRILASASSDNTIRLWDVASGEELTVFKAHEGESTGITFSPDGRTLASASSDNTVRLWNVANEQKRTVFKGDDEALITAVSFSPDGKKLALAATIGNTFGAITGVSQLWDIATGKKEFSIYLELSLTHDVSVTFSPDGKMLALVHKNTIQLLNVDSGRELAVFKGHDEYRITKVSFTPDGKIITAISDDGIFTLWDVTSGKELSVSKGHEEGGYDTLFSIDEQRIWDSSISGKDILLLDIKSGQELVVLKGHDDEVTCTAFSPDGMTLASASDDHTIRLWDLRPYSLFLHNSKPTPLYHTFIEAVKFLWQLDVEGLEIVETERRTPADLKKYGTLLAPPPPGQSKFEQVLEWAQQQQEANNKD
ncbi:MAG: hypothetical protein V8K32_08920 [Candidatus Electrothrix gigas]